jgi:hypothetical protein
VVQEVLNGKLLLEMSMFVDASKVPDGALRVRG